MLTQGEANEMERWVLAARSWGESSQGLVGVATQLSTISRELADQLDRGSGPFPSSGRSSREDLARQLRSLALVIEEQMGELRDDYLATAASMEQLGSST